MRKLTWMIILPVMNVTCLTPKTLMCPPLMLVRVSDFSLMGNKWLMPLVLYQWVLSKVPDIPEAAMDRCHRWDCWSWPPWCSLLRHLMWSGWFWAGEHWILDLGQRQRPRTPLMKMMVVRNRADCEVVVADEEVWGPEILWADLWAWLRRNDPGVTWDIVYLSLMPWTRSWRTSFRSPPGSTEWPLRPQWEHTCGPLPFPFPPWHWLHDQDWPDHVVHWPFPFEFAFPFVCPVDFPFPLFWFWFWEEPLPFDSPFDLFDLPFPFLPTWFFETLPEMSNW